MVNDIPQPLFRRLDKRNENDEAPIVYEFVLPQGTQTSVTETWVPLVDAKGDVVLDERGREVMQQDGPSLLRIWLPEARADALDDIVKADIDTRKGGIRSQPRP